MRSVKDIFRSYAAFNADGKHVWGTDRESNHSYGDAYEKMLMGHVLRARHDPDGWRWTEATGEMRSRRNDVKLMMEIGVADGNSLLAWREVFPNAVIVGMDVNLPAYGDQTIQCVEFHLGDQRKRKDCERASRGRKFDMIVDDASHHIPDVLTCLLWLWPFVQPGGLYVIEDLGADVMPNFKALWPGAEIVDTVGPFVASEPLIVLRKPS